MALPLYTDVGAVLDGTLSHTEVSVTAAGAGDNVAAVGEAIDRQGYDTCAFLLSAQATLAQDETLALVSSLLEEADAPGGPWTSVDASNVREEDFGMTGPTGGGTVNGAAQVNCNLQPTKRYVRLTFTPDLSAGGVDTAAISVACALSGKLTYE
jgi:hypothetical protein